MKSKRVKTADYSDLSQRLYLTEKYELSWGEQIVNALRKFVGLPEEFVEENNFSLNIVAEYDEVEEDLPLDEEELIDDGDLIDDVEKPTAEIKETESKDVTEETKSVEETKPTEKETAAAVEPSSKDETKEETKAKETEKASEKETVSETKDKSEEPETKAEKATKAADDEKATVEDKNKKDDEDVKLSISPKKVRLQRIQKRMKRTMRKRKRKTVLQPLQICGKSRHTVLRDPQQHSHWMMKMMIRERCIRKMMVDTLTSMMRSQIPSQP